NLLPVPPFDGSRIFGALLPDKIYFGIMKYEQYIFIVIFALLMFGVLDKPLYIANSAVTSWIDSGTRFIDKMAYSFAK
ncbi:MAG: site-2 protease family protein, partial [Oscillospiraceae bacterium]